MADEQQEKETEVREKPPKANKEERTGIVGPEPSVEDTPTRHVPGLPTDVKEHTLVADEDKEPGSGPIVEQHLEDHIAERLPPRESDTEASGASHLDDPWRA